MKDSNLIAFNDFITRWQRDQYSITGSVNLHDLCWIARITTEDTSLKPLFPQALTFLQAKWNDKGELIKPSTLAYCNFVTTLVYINTLILSEDSKNNNFSKKIYALLSYAYHMLSCMQNEFYNEIKLYGKHFKFTGLVGKWTIPAYECRLLLQHGSHYLSDAQKKQVQSYADLYYKLFPPDFDFAKLLAANPLVFHFAECFPEKALRLPLVQSHVNAVTTLPGYTAAFSARYYQLTRHKKPKLELEKILDRPQDGLLPNRKLTEVIFILYYLLKAGIDVSCHCKSQIDYLREHLHVNGVGVEPRTSVLYPDCDTSAVAQYVCHALKLPLKMPTKRLDKWWNAEQNSYQSSDGHYTYNLGTILHVLDAYIIASDVSLVEKQKIWERTITLLEQKPWEELHHLSPYYIWEAIITTFFTHAEKFPQRTTQVHYEALRLLLKFQDKSGGFYSHYLNKPTLEETALALSALKSVLAVSLSEALHQQIKKSADRAQEFLLDNIANNNYPEFWVGKLLGVPKYIIEAIIVASLNKKERDY